MVTGKKAWFSSLVGRPAQRKEPWVGFLDEWADFCSSSVWSPRVEWKEPGDGVRGPGLESWLCGF